MLNFDENNIMNIKMVWNENDIGLWLEMNDRLCSEILKHES
jgi:hypothetical protein